MFKENKQANPENKKTIRAGLSGIHIDSHSLQIESQYSLSGRINFFITLHMLLAQHLPTWVALAVSFSACPTEPSLLKEWTLLLPQLPLDLRGSSLCSQVELNSLAQLHLWSHKAPLLFYSFSCIYRSLIPFLCTGSMLMDLFPPTGSDQSLSRVRLFATP